PIYLPIYPRGILKGKKNSNKRCLVRRYMDIAKIAVNYAFKLLFQELQSLMIRPALILEDNA
ncbi:MAG: hypothetical protein ACFFB3_24495, partial [Candidatus Hodarchaeota archaeon]